MENDLIKVIPVINHRGILLEKMCGGYRVFGKVVKTLEEADEVIDQSCSILSESIVTIKNNNSGEMECTNDENLNK